MSRKDSDGLNEPHDDPATTAANENDIEFAAANQDDFEDKEEGQNFERIDDAQANKDTASMSPEEEATSYAKRPVFVFLLWALSLALAISSILFAPSFSSLLFLLGAAITCPGVRPRLMGALELPGRMPARMASSVSAVVTPGAPYGVLITVLLLVGIVCAPLHGELSLYSFLELQAARTYAKQEIEYSAQPVNPDEYLARSTMNISAHVIEDLDAHQVGEQELGVEVSEGVFKKKDQLTFVVRDTKAPIVVLKNKEFTILQGETFDMLGNVESVKDPVDGDLKRVDKEPRRRQGDVGVEQVYDEGWYLVNGDYDNKVPGDYSLKVKACDQHGNETEEVCKLTVKDVFDGVVLTPKTTALEYSHESVDLLSLVWCDDESVSITADGEVDLSSLHDVKATYTMEKRGFTKDESITFTVRDTKKPVIDLVDTEVVIENGGDFDPNVNVASVSDPVDGDLPFVDVAPSGDSDGWYTVQGKWDASRQGTYTFKVMAEDRNGNSASREFKLTVLAAPKIPPALKPHNYVLNMNTMKFHNPYCYDVKKIKDYNRWDVYMTKGEVLDMGYVPCKHCNP